MKLVSITDIPAWEHFQTSQTWSQFTQAWNWGEFRRSLGLSVRRFALIDENGKWLAACQMEFHAKSLVGGYWFMPRGPIFSVSLPAADIIPVLEALLQELLKQPLSRSLFWRLEPLVELGQPEGLMPLRCRRNDAHNPSSTLLLDLSKSREELEANLKQKTRYNIRLAERHGVTTRIATHPNDLKKFLDLVEETAARDSFVPQSRDYLSSTFKFLDRLSMARIRLAERNGKVLAANLEVVYGNTVTYLHGASSGEARNVMAPFILHWDAITEAQRDGFHWYDFWGVNPLSKAAFSYKPSWDGITRFKLGWSGERRDLYGTWDLPFFMPLYRLVFWRHSLRS